jgi:ubiquinone/menaquinone biosynthesis C-methylase UbiE
MPKAFDEWPEKYDLWFKTPIGSLIRHYESKLTAEMLEPVHGELILDAGCGTGVFTGNLLSAGARVVGLELSLPMLHRAAEKLRQFSFQMVQGDMTCLPFTHGAFDKTVSLTALEFIDDARAAISELFRVTKPGGRILVATLNSLSPWARRREAAGKRGHPLFSRAIFRSPDQLKALSPLPCVIKTAIHFQKDDNPDEAKKIEKEGQMKSLATGAFLAACWRKPACWQKPACWEKPL